MYKLSDISAMLPFALNDLGWLRKYIRTKISTIKSPYPRLKSIEQNPCAIIYRAHNHYYTLTFGIFQKKKTQFV